MGNKRYAIWEEKPSQNIWDAHFLGNGRLGLIVPGGVPLETVTINDDTLWSGSEEFRLNEGHYDAFRRAQRLALDGKVKQANDIINTQMDGRWFETYLPLAELYIMNGQSDNHRTMPLKRIVEASFDEFTGYRRNLDLSEAVETVSWYKDGNFYKREYFVSHVRGLAFIRLSGAALQHGEEKELNTAIGLGSKLHYEYTVDGAQAYLTGVAPTHAEPSYTTVKPGLVYAPESGSNALRFGCCVRIVETDGEVASDTARIYVKNSSYIVIAIAAGTNYEGFGKARDNDRSHLLEKLIQQLDNVESISEEKLRAEHIADYKALYNRVDIDLGTEITGNLPTTERFRYSAEGVDDPSLSALIMQYARYLVISGSRPESQALNLQGIWNDSLMPPWSSNYTNNINVQMNYWPVEILNLSECHLPLMNLLTELSQSGVKTAEKYYHMRGWVTHHNTDLWRSTEPSCEDASWSWWPFGGAWLCEHIWTHYEFTRDEGFLRQMYPVLRSAAVFMLDFLVEDNDGYLVTAPSVSPENKFICGHGEDTVIRLINDIGERSRCSSTDPEISAVTVASTMDMSILRELFGNLIAAAKILGVEDDEIPSKAEEAIKRFPPYKTGRFGQLLEWKDDVEERSPGMSHISHMYPVYPGALFTENKNEKLFEAARRSLERRLLHAAEEDGWPGSWRLSLMARFHNTLECGHLIKTTVKRLGAGMLTCEYAQIDSVFGLGAGIGEMLLQSHQGYIEIIPSITVDWAKGSFRGLRARGGFEVSANWSGGMLVHAEVISVYGGKCSIKAKGLRVVCDEDGKDIAKAEANTVSLETVPGQKLVLVFDENPIANMEYHV